MSGKQNLGRLWLLLALLPQVASAQLPPYLTFDHYTPKDGLTSVRIYDIVQDGRGFLWVATATGLNRFDGQTFRRYQLPSRLPGEFSDDTQPAFALDGRGQPWLLTQLGLHRYDLTHDAFRAVRTPLDGSSVRANLCLLHDPARNCLWITTSRGLMRSELRTGQTIQTSIRAFFKPYRSVLIGDGRLLIAASEGAMVYDPATDESRFFPVDDDGNEHFIAAFRDADGQLWMGRNGRGLVQFNPDNGRATHYMPPPSVLKSGFVGVSDITTVPAVTGDSILWLATLDNGLLFFNRRSRRFVGNYTARPYLPQGLFSQQIDRLYLARDGRLWLADQALSQLDPANQAMHTELLNLPPVNLQNMVPDRERPSHYWLASNGFGLLNYDLTNHRIHYRLQYDSLRFGGAIADPVTSPQSFLRELHYDRAGRLWATSGAGLHCYEAGKPPRLLHPLNQQSGFPANANVITTDNQGVLWGSANELLYRLDSKTGRSQFWQLSAWPGQTDFPVPTQIYPQGNRIWVGSTAGLFRVDRQTGRVLNRYLDEKHGDPLLTNVVYGIAPDPDGTLWLACHENGLKHLDPRTGRFEQIAALKADQVHPFSVRRDGRGFIWMQTNNGLYRYQPATRRLMHPQAVIPPGDLENYSPPAPDPAGGWFAVQGGTYFTRFDPERITDYYPPPRPFITGFRVFDAPQPIAPDSTDTHPFRLRYDQNVITFEFTAPQFSRANDVKFAYQLVGFDADWVVADSRRTATYTNLDGGAYTFRVRAANALGQWHPQGAAFQMVVSTPFWRAWWFYAGCALAFVGVVFLVFNAREQQRLRLLLIRERIARDLHDDMGSYLSSISILSQTARLTALRDPQRTQTTLDTIGETARHVLEAMSDIVWSVNPVHDSLGQLAERMRDVAANLFTSTNTRCTIETDDALTALALPAEHRRDVFLIFKEALTNAARYAEASHVQVSLKRANHHLCLTVADNGRGFDVANAPGRAGGGNGLGNMQARANKAGGVLTITAAPGQGTSVVFRLPV